ncbi:MAG: hypothetical protein ABSC32_01915 [Steroidobacteraceae bacterium]|jgi:hypothetical protein
MKLRLTLARRLTFGLCGLGGLAAWSTAYAQASPSAPPMSWSAVNLPDTPIYQDRFIAGGSLAPDISAGDATTGDGQGLARSLQVDGVVSALSSRDGGSSSNVMENGVVVKSQWETQGYGAWSLDASARTGGSDLGPSEQGQGGVITLRERGMPFDGDWFADNALGDINTPDIGLARFQPRFLLPTSPVQGLTTEWRGPDGLQLVAGGGVPGLYDGIEVPDFRTLGGSTTTAGAQWSPASNWTVGGQLVSAHDVNLAIDSIVDSPARLSSTTGLVTAGWQDRGDRLQFNLLDSEVSGQPDGVGAWVDGSISQGRFQQNAGLFRIDPNMTWGNQPISNDMQGGYYRVDYQSRQWLADAGIDEVRSVSNLGTDTTFLTGDARYQASRDTGVGGVADVSRTDGANGWSLEGYVDHLNAWGTGREQADFAATPNGRDTTLTLNQTWSMPVGVRLSTSTYVERIDGAIINDLEQNSTVLGLAAAGGGQFTARLGLEGNVQWAAAVQGRAAPGVSANVALTYQISRTWQILATYYDSRTGSWTPLTVVSPIGPPVPTAVPAVDERGIFLTLRYKRASGSHFAPMGGAPGTGAGEIAGVVYLDANGNQRFDAGEAGVPNVTVVLDGRFSSQTDANGRFDFPAVATGHHVITVISDNLPLPWALPNEGRMDVQVSTRDRTQVNIGALRPR